MSLNEDLRGVARRVLFAYYLDIENSDTWLYNRFFNVSVCFFQFQGVFSMQYFVFNVKL